VLGALPQFIVHAIPAAVFVDPDGNRIQYEFNRWIMRLSDVAAGHG
jgi:hypothetical protein